MRATRLLIAESVPLLRGLIVEHLRRQTDLEVVAEADSGEQAIELARDLHPTVAVLGLELVGVNGADAAGRMRANLPALGIVLLTPQPQMVSLGVWCGASECLAHSCAPSDLLAAVRRAARPAPLAAPATAAATAAATGRTSAVTDLALHCNLSEKERAVVEKMVITELTTAQIARQLSRENNTLFTESSVKHALERALHKMSVEPRTRTALLRRILDLASPNITQQP